MKPDTLTIADIRKAVETRDAKSLKAFYADDAVLTIIDSNNPPSKPRTISGAQKIGEFYDDVCGRDMTHTFDNGIMDDEHLAFVEGCRYADGTHVIVSAMADLGPRGIVKQTIVQAWDN